MLKYIMQITKITQDWQPKCDKKTGVQKVNMFIIDVKVTCLKSK